CRWWVGRSWCRRLRWRRRIRSSRGCPHPNPLPLAGEGESARTGPEESGPVLFPATLRTMARFHLHFAERAMALHPVDLFDVRSLLTEEERSVQDTVARFTDERVLPIIGNAFDEGRFPRELVGEIAEMGLLGSSLPEEYGCAGLNSVSYGLICQELERGDSGIRSFVSVQSSLCMYPIFAYGTEEQKQRWLPDMAAGKVIGCFGLTEAHGGSDPATMKTHARRDGDDWVLNGSKM